MGKIKKVGNKVLEVIGGIGATLFLLAWCVTIVCITYGLAIWSAGWFFSLL